MALSKIQAESMNLADTYAFSGTVTGAGDPSLVKIHEENVTSSVTHVAFTSTHITDTYHTYGPPSKLLHSDQKPNLEFCPAQDHCLE